MYKRMLSTRGICISAVIAAVYAVLTYALAPISYGMLQFRVSEALTLLPILLPEAIPGLFIGCLIANLMGGLGIIDIVFGSLATLLAAICTYRLRSNKWLAALPPVVINGIVIGLVLHFAQGLPLLESMGYVALGQAGACYVLGQPLLLAFKKMNLDKLV